MKGYKVDIKPIPWKRRQFAYEWCKDFNGAEAYKRAGYCPANANVARTEACRLLKDPRVQQIIHQIQEERKEEYKVDDTYVISNFVEIVERCMQRQTIKDPLTGNEIICPFNPKSAAAALTKLGESIGTLTGKNEILPTEHIHRHVHAHLTSQDIVNMSSESRLELLTLLRSKKNEIAGKNEISGAGGEKNEISYSPPAPLTDPDVNPQSPGQDPQLV